MLKFQGQNARLRFPAFSFQKFSRGAGSQTPLEMMGFSPSYGSSGPTTVYFSRKPCFSLNGLIFIILKIIECISINTISIITNLSSKTIKLSWQPILFSAMFAMGASHDQETLLSFIGILQK